MGVRPPTDDTADESVEFGLPVLAARLDEADIDFPATQADVLDAVETTTIPYDATGHTLDLSDAFEQCSSEEFGSRTELLDELHPVFEYRRENTASGVLARLRTLLPL